MDILFRRGEATVSEVMADLPDPPTYSAVRSILRILSEKGQITHRDDRRHSPATSCLDVGARPARNRTVDADTVSVADHRAAAPAPGGAHRRAVIAPDRRPAGRDGAGAECAVGCRIESGGAGERTS